MTRPAPSSRFTHQCGREGSDGSGDGCTLTSRRAASGALRSGEHIDNDHSTNSAGAHRTALVVATRRWSPSDWVGDCERTRSATGSPRCPVSSPRQRRHPNHCSLCRRSRLGTIPGLRDRPPRTLLLRQLRDHLPDERTRLPLRSSITTGGLHATIRTRGRELSRAEGRVIGTHVSGETAERLCIGTRRCLRRFSGDARMT